MKKFFTFIYQFIHQAVSPKTCYQRAQQFLPWLISLCLITFVVGVIDGLFLAPPDYQQGDAYRIMFVHVPTAIWSLGVYMIMVIAVILYLVWKIKIADAIAKVSAPIGAIFTLLALITGSIWGKPTWGTWWIWDARLTSELILLFIYAGIIALRGAMPEPQLGARASGILTLVGMVNIPIIHYSVDWWQTLHQGATILKLGRPAMAASMLYPLLIMICAFFFYYLVVLLVNLRHELLQREQHTHWVKTFILNSKKDGHDCVS